MSELRATSSTLLSVIEATARRPAEVVGAISTFCFALLAADLFCIATGRHSWSAVAVYIGRIATDKPLATPVSIGIVIATLAVLMLISEITLQSSGLKYYIMSDLAATIPTPLWAETPQSHWKMIFAWAIMIPLMANISLILADSTGLFQIMGLPVLLCIFLLLTIGSSWVGVALLYGFLLRGDRYAITAVIFAGITNLLIVSPFGTSLQDVAPTMFTTHLYGSAAPDAALISFIFFYLVIISRTLLAFLKMQRDSDRTVLAIEDSEQDLPILVVDCINKMFNRPHYLYIESGTAPIIAFARLQRDLSFRYIAYNELRKNAFRIDIEEIKIVNLRRIKNIVEAFALGPEGSLGAKAKVILELKESLFAATTNIGENRFSPLEQQTLFEIFNPDDLGNLLKLWFFEVVHEQEQSLLAPLRPIETFVKISSAKLDSAVLKGDTNARKGAALLDRNSAGAMGQGEVAATEIDNIMGKLDGYKVLIEKADEDIAGLALNIPKSFSVKMQEHINKRCGEHQEHLKNAATVFADALGPRLIDVSCSPPKLLESLKSDFSLMAEKINQISREIQARRSEGAEADAARFVGMVSDPGLRGSQKVEIVDIGYGRQRSTSITTQALHQIESDRASGIEDTSQRNLDSADNDFESAGASGSRPGQS